MVAFRLTAPALVALATVATATPTPSPFSFVDWVEDIAASPSTALKSRDAVAAFEAAQVSVDSRSLAARAASCYNNDNLGGLRGAALCISRLAESGLPCTGGETTRICTAFDAGVTLISPEPANAEPCIDVARAIARIVDSCTVGEKAGGKDKAGIYDVHLHWGKWPTSEGGPTLS